MSPSFKVQPEKLRRWMFTAVLLGVPLASYFLVFRPQNAEIARAKAEIEVKRGLPEQVKEETARSADLRRANDEMKSAISAIEARLPSDKEMDLVLRDVAHIAARAGLNVPNFRRAEKSLAAGTAMEQPLEVELTGDFDGLYRFLIDIERLPRITRLTDLKIERSDTADGAMRAEFTLSVYYQGESFSTAAPTKAGNQ